MTSETITRGSEGTLPRTPRSRLRALRHRGHHRSAAAAPPARSVEVPAEPAAVQTAAEPPKAAEEFVWTPAKRVSLLAALVWIHHGNTNLSEREEVDVNFHGINNAILAGLVRRDAGDWQVTDEGIEQLRRHDLMDTYTVAPVAV
jgi:hypothetical protein